MNRLNTLFRASSRLHCFCIMTLQAVWLFSPHATGTAKAAAIVWSGNGVFGTDPFGHSWTYYVAPAHSLPSGTSLFSIPGLGVEGSASGLTIEGLQLEFDLPSGISVDIQTPEAIGSGNSTIFYHSTKQQIWPRSQLGLNAVEFTALPASPLNLGEQFFANVLFDAPIPGGVSFTATWYVVPEPSTVIHTFALCCALLSRRKTNRSAPAGQLF